MHELRHRWTYQLQLHTESNATLYHLIFATDPEPGAKIMRHLYAQAVVAFPQMASEYRALEAQMASEATGQTSLFDISEISGPKNRPPAVTLPDDPPNNHGHTTPLNCLTVSAPRRVRPRRVRLPSQVGHDVPVSRTYRCDQAASAPDETPSGVTIVISSPLLTGASAPGNSDSLEVLSLPANANQGRSLEVRWGVVRGQPRQE